MKKVAVVIPTYKTSLSVTEYISLQQAHKILGKHDIYLAMPEGLDFCGVYEKNNFFPRKVFFSKEYFEDISGYNRLMLDRNFYAAFAEYEYILIYQLDAFVFRDELLDFCNLEYDYIGAPWLSGRYHFIDRKHCIWRVGNGGLSLRKVSAFRAVLEKKEREVKQYTKNEDLFFSMIIDSDFHVAPVETALRFAFEREVKECFEKNGYTLPFGCHAWERYDLDFWRPYIEAEGYRLVHSMDMSGKEDEILQPEYEKAKKLSHYMEQEVDFEMIKQRVENSFSRKDKPVVIFGAGTYGQEMAKWLKAAGVPVKCFYDNRNFPSDVRIEGHIIRPAKELGDKLHEVNVIIAVKTHAEEIAKQMEEEGFVYKRDYLYYTDAGMRL